MKEQEEQEKVMVSNPMNGAVSADYAKADITTRRNASILVDTATSVAVTRVLSAVEEEKEETGTTILDKTKDTGTKIKNSGDQRVMTKPTRKQVREKEHQVKH